MEVREAESAFAEGGSPAVNGSACL